MEIVKSRKESLLLTIVNELNKRRALSYEEKQAKTNLEKGFIGEVQFDQLMTDHMEGDAIVLQDLLLEIKGNSAQIDSIVLTPEVAHIYEIKNYGGDYEMDSGQLRTLSGKEISNPLTQLNRTSSLLRQLFQSWNITIRIEARIVFVNSAFVLYHAKPEDPIIFPGQIKSHFSKVSHKTGIQSGIPKKVHQLAKRLLEEHRSEVSFQKQLPTYDYEDLKKGLTCRRCGSFEIEMTQRSSRCMKCTQVFSIDEAVLTQINAYKLLFPDSKLTVKRMYDWCGERVSRNRIRRLLVKHYKKSSLSTGTHYK